MADAIVINKAEGANLKRAQIAKSDFERAMHLYPPKENGWTPKVLTCSAIENQGIQEIWDIINDYLELTRANEGFKNKRKDQNKYWFLQTVENLVTQRFYGDSRILKQLENLTDQVETNKISPFRAAEELLRNYGKELK